MPVLLLVALVVLAAAVSASVAVAVVNRRSQPNLSNHHRAWLASREMHDLTREAFEQMAQHAERHRE